MCNVLFIVVGNEATRACDTDQLCSGLEAGIEGGFIMLEPLRVFWSLEKKDVEKAEKITGDNGCNFRIKTGYRYLGSYIGGKERQTEWVEKKTSDWIKAVENLAEVDVYVPQSVYAGMQRALQQEWTFMQRVIP